MKKIALMGECMIELNGQLFGDMVQKYGGDSLNTATYMSRIAKDSLHIDYVTALGTDAISQKMCLAWQDEGINTDLVMLDAHRQPGLYLIQLDEKGERVFLYWRNESAASRMVQHPQFQSVMHKLADYDMLYISGISLAILPPVDRQSLMEGIKELKKGGVKIAFDSNYRPNLWQSVEETRSCYKKMYALSDIALITDDDEYQLWNESSTQDIVARLRDCGLSELIIKQGAMGCEYHNFVTGAQEFIQSNKVEHVVDTTSAGDAFNAGYLAGMLLEKTPVECAKQGHNLGAIVIQHKGAIIPNTVQLS